MRIYRNFRSLCASLCASLVLSLSLAVPAGAAGALITWDGSASTSYKAVANWTPEQIPTLEDTLAFAACANACVLDTQVYAHHIPMSAAMDQNFKQNGYRITTVAGASFDAVGVGDTVSLDSALVVTGDGGIALLSGPKYVISANNCDWSFQGTGTIDLTSEAVSIHKLTAAASGKTTTLANNNLTTMQAVLGAGVFACGTKYLNCRPTLATDLSLDVDNTITLGSAGAIDISPAAAITLNIPKITTTGAGGYTILDMKSNYNQGMSFQGNITTQGTLYFRDQAAGTHTTTWEFNSVTITAPAIVFGKLNPTATTNYNLGAATIDANTYTEQFTGGTFNLNLQTSTWYHAGDLKFNQARIAPGTGSVIFDKTSGTQVIKCAMPDSQHFYDVEFSGAADGIDSTAGGIRVDGDFSRTGAGALTLVNGMQAAGDVTIDGAGALTSKKITASANDATVHIGDVGAVAVSRIDLTGTAPTLDIDEASTIDTLSQVAATRSALTGAAAVTYTVPPQAGDVVLNQAGSTTFGSACKLDSVVVTGGTLVTGGAGTDSIGYFGLDGGALDMSGDTVWSQYVRGSAATDFIYDAASVLKIKSGGRMALCPGDTMCKLQPLGSLALDSGGSYASMALVDGSTYTWQAGKTFTPLTLAAADWTGASPTRTAFRSNSTGTQFTIAVPNAITVSWMNPQDCAVTGYSITATDGTSLDGGNNTGWIWPSGGVPGALDGAYRLRPYRNGVYRLEPYRLGAYQ